jgi:hypothetical protein
MYGSAEAVPDAPTRARVVAMPDGKRMKKRVRKTPDRLGQTKASPVKKKPVPAALKRLRSYHRK